MSTIEQSYRSCDPPQKLTFEQERCANREANQCFDLKLCTRVPSKWRVIDLETGQVYKFAEMKGRAEATHAKPYLGWTKTNDITFKQVDKQEEELHSCVR